MAAVGASGCGVSATGLAIAMLRVSTRLPAQHWHAVSHSACFFGQRPNGQVFRAATKIVNCALPNLPNFFGPEPCPSPLGAPGPETCARPHAATRVPAHSISPCMPAHSDSRRHHERRRARRRRVPAIPGSASSRSTCYVTGLTLNDRIDGFGRQLTGVRRNIDGQRTEMRNSFKETRVPPSPGTVVANANQKLTRIVPGEILTFHEFK